MFRLTPAAMIILLTPLSPLSAQDTLHFTHSGISFDYPKDWKVASSVNYGIVTITVKHPGGAQAVLQLHPPGSNAVGVRIQQERSLQQANEGKLDDDSNQAVKRSFSAGIQEGTILVFKSDGEERIHFEVYAFTLTGKKRHVCLAIFQHPAKQRETAERGFALVADTLTEDGAPRPAVKTPPAVPGVRLSVPVPRGWQLLPAQQGVKLWEDQFLEFTQVPKELMGGQLVLRNVADAKAWLAPERVAILRDCTVYAIVRTKYLGKVTVPASILRQLGRDGWIEVEEPVKSSFPPGEDWGWRVLKRTVRKGDDFPELRGLILGQPVVFVFK